MADLARDVEELNVAIVASLLLAFSDRKPLIPNNSIAVSWGVSNLLNSASSEECSAICKCGSPLISINNKSLQLLQHRLSGLSIGRIPEEAGDTVSEINFTALMLAYVLIKTELIIVAKLWFGLNDESVNIIRSLSMANAQKFARETSTLVDLRNSNDPTFWSRLMMTGTLANTNSHTIGDTAAFMSLG